MARGSIVKKGGAYYVVYRVGTKQRWRAAGTRKKDAERLLQAIQNDLADDSYRELTDATFEHFARLWLDSYCKTALKPATIALYENFLRARLIPYFGTWPLRAIRTADVQRFIAESLRDLAPSSAVRLLNCLKRMLTHAVDWGYLRENPASKAHAPRIEHREMEFLRPHEIRMLLRHVQPRHRPFFTLAVFTGLRLGELLALQWDDVDWRNRRIHVRRSVWRNTPC